MTSDFGLLATTVPLIEHSTASAFTEIAIVCVTGIAAGANGAILMSRGGMGTEALPTKTETAIRVMTWNTAGPATPPATIAKIAVAMDADIVALPETTIESGEQVVVNAGFVPNEMQGRAEEDRAVAPLLTGKPETLTGYLRFPEHPGFLTAHENEPKRLWFIRDVPGIAASLNWGKIAPFYIDLEQPVPLSGVPKPGPLEIHLKDDHMQYAITWFGLAAAVAIAFAVWFARTLSDGRDSPETKGSSD